MSVSGVPYVHWKVINEKEIENIDYNYVWATTVETNKGPINTPVYIKDAQEAKQIFNINMDGYFAQNPRSLIMVRVAQSSNVNALSKGSYNFMTEKDIVYYYADYYTVEFGSGATKEEVRVYCAQKDDGSFVPVIPYKDASGVIKPQKYTADWKVDGTANVPLTDAYDSTVNSITDLLVPVKKTIPAGTSLLEIVGRYEGDYGVLTSIQPSLLGDGYNITIQEPSLGTIAINNVTDIVKVANKINDKSFNILAEPTKAGNAITYAIRSYPKACDTEKITVNGTEVDRIVSLDIGELQILKLGQDGDDESTLSVLTTAQENALLDYEAGNITVEPTVKYVPYKINLVSESNRPLIGGSNGAWNSAKGRILDEYQALAHEAGLKTLQRIRLSGVFCMYGEDKIINEYVKHGKNPQEPEKGMNNDESCKWRTILVGGNASDRTDVSSLCTKASALNDQFILYLGQGLIDTGMTGVASTMNAVDKQTNGIVNENQLLPYECTQYVAGLRSKLDYGESIFGGQGRKRIRGVGELSIAPLLEYDDEFTWEPKNYITLNEAGVLTFTEDYGQITLTDGVTTRQGNNEEDEEGVMNILKYAQNAIYDVCLPFIGRNIDSDLQHSIQMQIESVLSVMENTDKTLISIADENISAYEVNVITTPRATQLLGKIQISLKITPVHALRQIEVEMTVQ